MHISNPSKNELEACFKKLDTILEQEHKIEWIKYADLGIKKVRIINYSKAFTSHVEKQLTYVLRDEVASYDATIVIWHEKEIKKTTKQLGDILCKPHRLKLEKIYTKKDFFDFHVISENYSKHNLLINLSITNGLIEAYKQSTNTYYYGVENLDPEEFIKQGHIFVQMFNKITRTENTHLVHGAVVGLNNEGVLFCARGQRGKSTLVFLSMLEGFEYVSDDYLILEKEEERLYSHPIYSIITLSPRMYFELYDKLDGTRFVSNNARKDKYVINIGRYHETFKKKYPIKFCMFPEIVEDENPSIVACEKGRSITQLIHSTVNQLQDTNNTQAIKKLLHMVSGFEFFKINLCQDINKNTQCLREFMQNYDKRERVDFVENKIYTDITFDLATFLDSEEGILYSMNALATNVYENLLAGVSADLILAELKALPQMPKSIEEDFHMFIQAVNALGILGKITKSTQEIKIHEELLLNNNYKLSFVKHAAEETIELVSKNEKGE